MISTIIASVFLLILTVHGDAHLSLRVKKHEHGENIVNIDSLNQGNEMNVISDTSHSHKSYTSSCTAPTYIGEIRNKADTSQCIDSHGRDGRQNVSTYSCNGYDDQIFKYCEDGTIRSTLSGFCLSVDGHHGKGNVRMSPCKVFPPAKYQQWDLSDSGIFIESGIKQKLLRIKNRMSKYCLDIDGRDGRGAVGTHKCNHGKDQILYFRSRGKAIRTGKLQNKESGWCLDVNGRDGRGNAQTFHCMDELDQVFTFYENGELVNEKSKLCINIDGHNGFGNIDTYACDARPDQHWKEFKKHGGYFMYVSKKSNQCLQVDGYDGRGNLDTYDCNDLKDQKWKWIESKWKTPTGRWSNVRCHDGVSIKLTIKEKITTNFQLTETSTTEISAQIETDLFFGSSTVSASVSESISKAWSYGSGLEKSIEVVCEFNDDDSPFTGGCLWQWNVDISSSEKKLKWEAGITKCTKSRNAPKCPPFQKCANRECTLCEDTF